MLLDKECVDLIFFLVCCSVVGENICALALITKRDQESIQEKFSIFDLGFGLEFCQGGETRTKSRKEV